LKNRIKAVTALIFSNLLIVPSMGAWGRLGHRVVAKTTAERLTPRALVAVHELLGSGITLADISTWADE
jgi:hypothetical protein